MLTEDKITTEMLKEKFPHKRIHDASDKPIDQILKILKLCEDVPDILVFIKRNPITEVYFDAIEQTEQAKFDGMVAYAQKRPSTVVINRDNYIWFDKECPNVIPAIHQMIDEETECIVCQEKAKDMQFLKCSCTTNLCKTCFQNLKGEKKCPVCKTKLLKSI